MDKLSLSFVVFILFFMSFCCFQKVKAGFHEFQDLSSDEIRENHLSLKKLVDTCYGDAEKHFTPGGRWSRRNDFDFKRAVNLCTIGVQWIIQTEEKPWITDVEIVKDTAGKNLVASNTSSCQWKTSVAKEAGFHMLSWPTRVKDTFYAFELMPKDVPTPKVWGDIKHEAFKKKYPESFKVLNAFLNDAIKSIRALLLNKTLFKNLTESQVNSLIKLENLFGKSFLIFRKGKPTDYCYVTTTELALNSFLKSYDTNSLDQQEIDIEVIVPETIIMQEKSNFLEKDDESDLAKFSYLLGVEKDQYKSYTAGNNVIEETRKIYPLDAQNEVDITHSEPILVWWVSKNMEDMRKPVLEKFTTEKGTSSKITRSFPIFFFYTERQTCPSCENIIQKKAYDEYVPLISFNNIYSPDFVLLSGIPIPLEARKYTPPYSLPSQSYSLDFFILQKLKYVKNPIDLHLEPFQVDYDKFFYQHIEFMKVLSSLSNERVKKSDTLSDKLEATQQQYESNLKDLSTNGNKENPARKALESIHSFHNSMLELIKLQISEEKALAGKTNNFIKNQEESLKYEQDNLNKFKRNFQRIPIQYKNNY